MRLLLALLACSFGFSTGFSAYAATSVPYIQQNALEVTTEIPASFVQELLQKHLILVGEMHGTNEMPKSGIQLLKDLSKHDQLVFGLEFPRSLQPKIDQFLLSGDEAILRTEEFFTNAFFHSGRGSKAMIEMLHNLRGLSNVKVVCFDVEADGYDEDRDTEMAQNVLRILAENPSLKVVIYTGNLHSRLTNGTPWDPNYINMGAEILRLSNGAMTLANTTSILYRYAQGSVWACMRESSGRVTCDARTFGPIRTAYSAAVPFGHFVLREPSLVDGHAYTYFIRELSASMPF